LHAFTHAFNYSTLSSFSPQHPSPQELALMMSDVDIDGSGEINFPEFVSFIVTAAKQDFTDPV
jgi:Ca2+-binding EF-hand superfamily protein